MTHEMYNPDALVINSFRGKYFFLSNFYRCEVQYESILYFSAEHAYQAAKTTNEAHRQIIADTFSHKEAKQLGKKVVLRDGWETIKEAIMEEILWCKFENEHLRELLLDTEDCPLVEGNTWGDRFWGVHNSIGQNKLGQLLMHIRWEMNR